MPDQQTEPGTIVPLFSIIIPLEYHRGQWERCWEGWKSQTLDKTAYEIILVVPPDFPGRDDMDALAADARLEFADCQHDIGLCAIGATKARGQYLLFTESHCWPEPDVLELCLKAFQDYPDWAGFSCKSVRITHNRVSEAEADMYQSDIEFGMKVHPWRKVLDQCFVTRREVYEECGGLRAELGHFAEWVLAAAYHARGHQIGYLEQARFHHYYVGNLDELKTFTLDFVEGEIQYFSQGSRGPGSDLLEVPSEWSCQDNFDAAMARGIVRMAAADVVAGGQWSRRLKPGVHALSRWISPALYGDGLVRNASAGLAFGARIVLMGLVLVGSRASIARWMKIYIAALIRYQRLNGIHVARREIAMSATAVSRLSAHVTAQTGFYPMEQWHDRAFRWSETEAAVRIKAVPGRNIIRLDCLPVREPFDHMDMRFYLDDRRVADEAITAGVDQVELQVDLPSSGTARLAWICSRFDAHNDSRRLGLPISRIEVAKASAASAR